MRSRPVTTPGATSAPDGRARLLRARDEDKDQTYFLYGLRQDQLDHARFPLGELTKPEVRAVARGLGLATADKPESQEICFVPGGDYRDALRERAGWARAGPDPRCGRRRGSGSTAARPGSRSGSGRGSASRSASRATSAGSIRCSNTIKLARREDLETRDRAARATSIRGRRPPAGREGLPRGGPGPPPGHAVARARPGRRPRGAASRGGSWIVETDQPVWAAAPGQAAVLYDGDSCSAAGGSSAQSRAEPPDPARTTC